MTVFELGDDIVVVDAGLAFPRDEHLGVDLVLPDIGYPRGRRGTAGLAPPGRDGPRRRPPPPPPPPPRPRGRAPARPRGPRRRAAVPAPRGRLRRGDRDEAHA